MKRRTGLLVGVGLAAGVAGWAWQRQRAPARDAAPDALWALKLARPEGGELAFASLRGAPMVLNFWATWCPPCVQEMPELDQFARQFADRGWRVVGLAVDNPAPVREFLKKSPVSYPIALAGFDGSQLSRELGNTQGGLPYTVLIDRQGRIGRRHAGQTRLAELGTWAAEI